MDVDESVQAIGDESPVDEVTDAVPAQEPAAHVSEGTESTAEAPQQRRKRGPQPLQIDHRQELTNEVLRGWNENYLVNMDLANRVKQQHRGVYEARRMATFFVYGQGIGNVGTGLGQARVAGPLVQFSGRELLQALLSPTEHRKHGRSPSSASENEVGRRVRTRSEDEEVAGNEQALGMVDDDFVGVRDVSNSEDTD